MLIDYSQTLIFLKNKKTTISTKQANGQTNKNKEAKNTVKVGLSLQKVRTVHLEQQGLPWLHFVLRKNILSIEYDELSDHGYNSLPKL